ncbi:Auxin-responsive protein SAUR50 [Bienertia sinuspersici]
MSDVDEIQDEHDHNNDEGCYAADSSTVPKDVKEGHFAVVAVDGGVAKRFVVPLRYLTHPMFLVLLEKAAEEYGFEHGGALTIPCRPSEIERMLAQRWEGGNNPRRGNNGWRNSNFMIQSY